LEFIERSNCPVQHLKEHLDFLRDIYYLRNLAQHYSSKNEMKLQEKLSDEELKKLIIFPTNGDMKLHPDLFKEVVKRLRYLIDFAS